jgi:1-acyl-sn-glycerol-3-phosphate acyltransferase
MVSERIVKLCQIIVYPLVYLPFRIIYHKKLSLLVEFKKEEKYIFVANHPSRIDPFLMFYLFSFKELIKILPLRFMTAEKYMDTSLKSFFLGLMGCYKIDENVLVKSKELLERGNNLCIFIQGKITKDYSVKPKVGAIYIEKASKNSLIVPVKIHYIGKKGIRKTAKITFKNSLRHKKFPEDLQPLANNLLRIIKK